MNMRLKILLAAAVCCVAISALWVLRAADQGKPPAGGPQTAQAQAPVAAPVPQWFPQAARFLHLSADQRTKLTELRDRTGAQLKAIRADATLSDDQKRAKSKDVVRAARVEAGAMLTDQQQKHLRRIQRIVTRMGLRDLRQWEFQRTHPCCGCGPRGQFGGMSGGPMPRPGPWMREGQRMEPFGGDIRTPRNLTPEQREKVDTLVKEFRAKVREVIAPPAQAPSSTPAPAAQPIKQ